MLPPRKVIWEIVGFFTLVTIMAGLGVWWEIKHFHPLTVALGVFLFVSRGLCITVLYHREGAHKQFKMNDKLRWAMAIWATGAVLLDMQKWVLRHLEHHENTDDT